MEETMEVLTPDELSGYNYGHIIDSGIVHDLRLHNAPVRWAAVVGGNEDWAIYYHHAGHTAEYVIHHGNKCFTEAIIKELVPCTDEAFKRYRF